MRRALQHAGAPVVVAFLAHANIVAILASLGQPWRMVISERMDPRLEPMEFPWTGLRERLYRRAALVTANSHPALEAMQSYVDPKRLVYLPNPLALPDPKTVPPPDERRNEFLAVGRLHPQKAFDVLLHAFARLPEQLREWRLVVVGRGGLRESLEALATSLGVAQRVQWCGHVADPTPYYRAARIFVQPSRHEGTSNALLEAMSFGLAPIVSDRSGGALDVVTDGQSGLVVPSEDAAALAVAMACLALDDALRARVAAAGRARLADFEMPRAMAAWDAALGLD